MSVLIIDRERKSALDAGFAAAFGSLPQCYFSAPGRTEIGGNHTDHQRGRVLAAAVNLDTVAAVRINGTDSIRILSEGYPMCQICLSDLIPVASEINTTPALVRGVAAGFAERGCQVGGFDAYCMSTVLTGSGLSSSWMYLQNVIPAGCKEHQDMAVALALCEKYWHGAEPSVSMAAASPVRFRPLCPLNCWIPSKRGLTRRWGKGRVMYCPSARRAVSGWRRSDATHRIRTLPQCRRALHPRNFHPCFPQKIEYTSH